MGLIIVCFCWLFHHIVIDKWSMPTFLDELATVYKAYSKKEATNLPLQPLQYLDYALWSRNNPVSDKNLNYWKSKLQDYSSLELPADFEKKGRPSFRGSTHHWTFSDEVKKMVSHFCSQQQITPFVFFLTIFKIFLSRFTNEDDIIVGYPFTNRDHPDLDRVIGFFDDTLVLRTDLSDNPTFSNLLARVRENMLEAFEHKDITFERLIKAVKPHRSLNVNPLFQTMFIYHDAQDLPSFGEDMSFSKEAFDFGVAKFDLTFYVEQRNGELTGEIEYSTDLFDHATIEAWSENFLVLLNNALDLPDTHVSEIQLLRDGERQRIFEMGTNTADLDEQYLIHQLIERKVQEVPDKVALSFRGMTKTYDELNREANSLAYRLLRLGIKNGQAVGLLSEASFEMIVGILGILKAGGAYLPLDPDLPDNRLQFILTDSGIDLVVLQTEKKNRIQSEHIRKVLIEEVDGNVSEDGNSLHSTPNGESTAYIIYTSGSTGQPKGVRVNHFNLLNSTLARFRYYEDQPGSFLLLSSFSFDSSVAGLFWTLAHGGKLIIPDRRIEQDLEALGELISQSQVTHTLLLPSLYSTLLQHIPEEDLKSLEVVIVAGEICPTSLEKQHFKLLPQTRFYNEYGPTEATVWSTVYEMHSGGVMDRVPIGRPIPNAVTYILDNNLQPVPIGVKGHLFIGGRGLSMGYLNRDSLNESSFLPNPFNQTESALIYRTGDLASYRRDGNIDYHGRSDNQIKLRGYRIEPEEITNKVLEIDGVKEAHVQSGKHDFQEIFDHDRIVSQLVRLEEADRESLISYIEKLTEEKCLELLNGDNQWS